MASRLKVTDLDFDTIKTNLKQFLNQQEEFSDYNFDGSSLSILIDLLAYNTHYNAYYLNMIANESFLDTALLRDSVVSHAKLLAYTPASKNAPIALVNIDVETGTTEIDTFTIPRGTKFSSEIIGDFNYNFVTIENYTVTKSNTKYMFENVELYEGILNVINFTQNNLANPNQIFVIPDISVDTRTIKVSVKENQASSTTDTYILSKDILDLNSSSKAFFLQEGRNGFYEIFFGDDFISKKLPDGAIITVSYLVTNGTAANKANSFVALQSIGGYTDILVTTTSSASGGSEKESVQSIKFSAPQRYATQNRLVTANDYSSYLKSVYPGIQSISVWGGEEQTPVVYNKTFISLKLKDGYFISELEKKRIVEEIIRPKAIITTEAEILEPDYLYILVNGKVKYDPSKTNLSSNDLKNKVISTVNLYNDNYLETFNSRYVQSRLQDDIDNSDPSFIGSVIETKMQKRVFVTLNEYKQYTVDFGVELVRGGLFNKLISKGFDIFDSQGVRRTVLIEEIPYSFSGIESIQILNPGFGYKSAPTVTISGDGTGAKAKAIIKNGLLSEIIVTNRGRNYTSASVTLTGGDGVSGSATAITQGNIGKVRVVYYDTDSTARVVIPDAGTIYYQKGLLELKELFILSLSDLGEQLRFTAYANDNVISSKRNLIVLIDPSASDSITVELVPII